MNPSSKVALHGKEWNLADLAPHAVHGAAALSLRAVARDLGVVSSAVYRYVQNGRVTINGARRIVQGVPFVVSIASREWVSIRI